MCELCMQRREKLIGLMLVGEDPFWTVKHPSVCCLKQSEKDWIYGLTPYNLALVSSPLLLFCTFFYPYMKDRISLICICCRRI